MERLRATFVHKIEQTSSPQWMTQWLLFNANSVSFQLYHGENNLHFEKMINVAILLYMFFRMKLIIFEPINT